MILSILSPFFMLPNSRLYQICGDAQLLQSLTHFHPTLYPQSTSNNIVLRKPAQLTLQFCVVNLICSHLEEVSGEAAYPFSKYNFLNTKKTLKRNMNTMKRNEFLVPFYQILLVNLTSIDSLMRPPQLGGTSHNRRYYGKPPGDICFRLSRSRILTHHNKQTQTEQSNL